MSNSRTSPSSPSFIGPDSPDFCAVCGAAADGDGICLACALGSALQAEPGWDDGSGMEAGFPGIARRLEPPCRFGRYFLHRELGRGGMGVVYEAEDSVLKRRVALKMIRGAMFASGAERARFQAEAAAAAVLDHPGIVPVHEVGEEDGQPYFTMKLIEGESLAEHQERGGAGRREAAGLMMKVARAVSHAHEHGVLHRDLKPANILLDGAGEPWLTDFGLAKTTHADRGLMLSGAHLGTPHYMSPEQAGGRTADVGTASDVWALGVILYELVTGRLPFGGDGPAAVMRGIVESEMQPFPPPPSAGRKFKAPGRADRDLETLIRRCLGKDPRRRPRGADFLAEELERWLAGRPILSRQVTPAERLGRWCRRHPLRVTGLAALTVSLVGGSALSYLQMRRAVEAGQALDLTNRHLSSALLRATALRLGAQAREELEEEPQRALLLAVEAVEMTRRRTGTVLPAAFNALSSLVNAVQSRRIGQVQSREGLSLSGNGRWLAAVRSGGRVELHDLSRPDRLPVSLSAPEASHIALSGNGERLAVSGKDGGAGEIRIFSVEHPQEAPVTLAHSGEINALAWSPDGGWLAAAGRGPEGGQLELWRPESGDSKIIKITGAEAGFWRAVFSHDGRWLAVTRDDEGTMLFCALSGDQAMEWVETSVGHKAGPAEVAFSPDGKWLASTDFKESRFVSLEGLMPEKEAMGERLKSSVRWTRHEGLGSIPEPLRFSPDSHWLAQGGFGGQVLLRSFSGSAEQDGEMWRFDLPKGENAVTFSQDGGTLIAGGFNKTFSAWELRDLRTHRAPRVLCGPDTSLRHLQTAGGGVLIGTGNGRSIGAEYSLWRWDTRPDGMVQTAAQLTSGALGGGWALLSADPAGRLLARLRQEKVWLWDTSSGQSDPWASFSGPETSGVIGVIFPPGGGLLTVHSDGTLSFWERVIPGQGPPVRRLRLEPPPGWRDEGGHGDTRTAAAHPDGRRLFTAGARSQDAAAGFIVERDSGTGAVLSEWRTDFAPATAVISPDGRWLAAGADGDNLPVLLYDLNSPNPPSSVRRLHSQSFGSVHLTFSPDSKLLAVGGTDIFAKIWDLSQPDAPEAAHTSAGFGSPLHGLSFSPDGETLAVSTLGGQVRLWNFRENDGAAARLVDVSGRASRAVWLPGNRLAVNTMEGRVHFCETETGVLLTLARRLAGRELTDGERKAFGLDDP